MFEFSEKNGNFEAFARHIKNTMAANWCWRLEYAQYIWGKIVLSQAIKESKKRKARHQ